MSAFNTVEQQKEKKFNPIVCCLKVSPFFLQNRKKVGSNWKDVPGASVMETAKNALNAGREKEQKALEGDRAWFLSSLHCTVPSVKETNT